MRQFNSGDEVVYTSRWGTCRGEVREVLDDNPSDLLYWVNFGEAGNFALRDSELLAGNNAKPGLNIPDDFLDVIVEKP